MINKIEMKGIIKENHFHSNKKGDYIKEYGKLRKKLKSHKVKYEKGNRK